MILNSIYNSQSGRYLIWTYPYEDFNTNSILTVNPGEEAIFVKNGEIVNVFSNGRYQLKTENYPFISKLRNVLSNGESTFKCKVLFVSCNQTKQINWGTDSPIQLRDPIQKIATKVVARGSYRVKVVDASLLVVKLLGMGVGTFQAIDLQQYFCNQLQQSIKSEIAQGIMSANVEVLETCTRLNQFSASLTPTISEIFDSYGLSLVQFSISGLDIPDGDPSRVLLEQAYAKKREVEIMNHDFARIKSADIMTNFSNNQGTGTFVGAGIGMGLGNQVAGPVTNLIHSIQGEHQHEDYVGRLETLKTLLDKGLITQQEYDEAKSNIINKLSSD